MDKTVNVEFNQDEISALGQLLDASVKATGLQGARLALPLLGKIEAAISAANTPSEQN
jgi:hypothetical protein